MKKPCAGSSPIYLAGIGAADADGDVPFRTLIVWFVTANNLIHSGVEMDSQQQQFCLKWNSFGSNLATSFSNLFKSESLADVTLFCDGE